MRTGRRRSGRARVPRIPAAWFRLAPGMPIEFWLAVEDAAHRRRVPKRDLAKVQAIIKEVRKP